MKQKGSANPEKEAISNMDYRMNGSTVKIEITELQNGDYIWNQGYLFEVSEMEITDEPKERYNKLLRYKGIVVPGVPGNDAIINTHFNGGRYGQNNGDTVLIVRRELLPNNK